MFQESENKVINYYNKRLENNDDWSNKTLFKGLQITITF